MSSFETKTCPDCAEDVKAAARVCRFCGYRFDGSNDLALTAARTAATGPLETQGSDAGASSESVPDAGSWRLRITYAASFLVWVLTVIPAGVSLIEEDTTEDIVASYMGAAIGSLGVAAVIRLAYAYVRKRHFLSPWLFVVASVINVLVLAGGTTE